MDPVAHTLFGAALAETGLRRATRYATATLVISANLPDIDVIAHVAGSDASLYFRRGWSHGVLALILLPVILTGLIWLWHRWRSQASTEHPAFRPGAVLGLAYIGVASHLLLDWMNTYGVRLLMPFDDRWFYGDTLFIIDPWFWLLAAVGVVLAWSRRPSAIVGWLLLATLASALILTSDLAPTGVKVLWLMGVVGIVALRWPGFRTRLAQSVTRAGLAALIVYAGAAYGLARFAETTAAEDFPEAETVQANPMPGLPHAHRMVIVEDGYYHIQHPDGEARSVEREAPDPVVREAMEDESIRGFMEWTRFPYWEVEEHEAGWVVHFYDLRYVEPGQRGAGIGYARVEVAQDSIDN